MVKRNWTFNNIKPGFSAGVFLALLLALCLSGNPLAAAEPLELLKTSIADLEKVADSLGENPDEAQKKAAEKQARSILEGIFDKNHLAALALGPGQWEKLTDAQKKEFEKIVHQLIVQKLNKSGKNDNRTVSDKIQSLRSRKLIMGQQTDYKDPYFKLDNAVKVSTTLPGDELDIPIDFLYVKEAELKPTTDWRVYDIQIDGRSQVYSYRKQFSSYIEKKGVQALIDVLKKKYNIE